MDIRKIDFKAYLPQQYGDIDISIYILTYYHEKYIRQALDSVLAQKTDYKYEIIVSDDHSLDGTMDILNEYKEKYPDIFRINQNKKNMGIPRNIYIARCMCRGRYIVNLAGDDYWINNNKLQEEVSFLDSHPQYIVLCSRVEVRYDDQTASIDTLPCKKETNKEFTIKDFEQGRNFNCHGLVMRNFFLTKEGREYFALAQKISDKVDDAVDNLLMLRLGRVYTIDLVTDVYRVPNNKNLKNNYNSRFSDIEKTKHEIELYNEMFKYFGNEIDFKQRYVKIIAILFLRMIKNKKWKEYLYIYKTIPEMFRKPFYKNIFFRAIIEAVKVVVIRTKNMVCSRQAEEK